MKVLAKYQSSSNPNTVHEVRMGDDGITYCTCWAWKTSKASPKTCKHLKAFFQANPTPSYASTGAGNCQEILDSSKRATSQFDKAFERALSMLN